MNAIVKSAILTLFSFFVFSAFQQAQAQLHVETSISGCSYQAHILWGVSPCSPSFAQPVTVVDGDNFYPIPPGMIPLGFRVLDAGFLNVNATVGDACLGLSNTDNVGDCSATIDQVIWWSGNYITIY